MRPRVAVLQFPGVNCEAETLRAVVRAGLEGEIFRWTRPPDELRGFQAYVLPGGFSWQDRVRAGALAAKDPMVRVVAEESSARVKPVLGICNGAQVLVEAGLVPGGGGVDLALARNRMPGRGGYYARWIHVRVEPSPCVFTRTLPVGAVLPLPIAHAEGRFTARAPGRFEGLMRAGQVPLRYAGSEGRDASGFPENPNGSDADAAAVCDASGLVLALMPHPERAQDLGQLSRTVADGWAVRRERAVESGEERDTPGPGLVLFEGLRRHLEEA
jgi:phosphoribosylformylglycinamidine synthase I